ncbi:MAG: hypothetical protein ABFE01_18930, partial [Phycisphaerales bacterium]
MRHRREFSWLTLAGATSLSILISICACMAFADPAEQMVGEPNDLRWDLAQAYEFTWKSAEVSSRATNPAIGSEPSEATPVRTISLSVSVDFDPRTIDRLVIIDVNGPQVCEVVDGEGRTVECRNGQSDVMRCYQDVGWIWDQDREDRAYTTTPKSFGVKVHLAGGPKQRMPSSISRLEGYIYATYAEDIIEVDVPFDPNSGWLDVEAAPDLTILVDPLTPPPPPPVELVCTLPNVPPGFCGPRNIPTRPKTSLGSYVFTTWVKSKTDQRVLGLRDPRYPSSSFAFGDYAVLRTELYDSKKNTNGMCDSQRVSGAVFFGEYGANCSGRGVQSRDAAFDRIR